MSNVARFAPPALSIAFLTACGLPHLGTFRVLPGNPDYALRSPDNRETPFPQILRRYNGFEPGRNGMDLRPLMELRIENAYYEAGKPKRRLDGFLGTEIARYSLQPRGGLQLLSAQSMNGRPRDQLPVEQLIPASRQHYRYYRFYFEILFRSKSVDRGSVLLGANSPDELHRAAVLLATQPDVACEGKTTGCVIFPEACSVSIEMQISINGARQSVLWGSSLSDVTSHPRQLKLLRSYSGRLIRVQLNALDPNSLTLPLLPGDRLDWQ